MPRKIPKWIVVESVQTNVDKDFEREQRLDTGQFITLEEEYIKIYNKRFRYVKKRKSWRDFGEEYSKKNF